MKSLRFLHIMVAAAWLVACGPARSGNLTAVPSLESIGVKDQATQASSENETGEASETPSDVPSGSYALVDTGQDFCYGDSGSMACPSEGAAYFEIGRAHV